ncbi:MAG: non-ribosomal peptide synthetase [Betaproteobacteria bacterium]
MTRATASSPCTLAQMLRLHARRTPTAAALVAPGRRVTSYAELEAQREAVARALGSADVRWGDRVAVALPQGPEMAAALLTFGAHASVVPCDASRGALHVRAVLQRSAARALVIPAGDAGMCAVAEALGVRVLEASWDAATPAGLFDVAHAGRAAAVPEASTHDIALILLTSGTTAAPKLVPLTHANVLHGAASVVATLGLTPADRSLLVMPLSHVHGIVAGLLASIAAGGSVACPGAFVADAFGEWVQELAPSWYTAVPTIHGAIVSAMRSGSSSSSCGLLRFVRSSSAHLPPRLAIELAEVFAAPVIEAYGMTEASHQIASTALPPARCKHGSVGRAQEVEVATLGADGALNVAGQWGEIVIRGPAVMTGYLDDDTENAAAFVDRWFRTGDAGVIDADGYVHLTGRLKEIINRGGEKIAPAEIEQALLAHPAVNDAAAFAIAHPTLGEDCAAAVAWRAGAQVSEEELRQFLLARLPAFKVPSTLWMVEEIPRSSTGKVQRFGLAERLGRAPREPTRRAATSLEISISESFTEVLGADGLRVSDNFFALGGDSLRGGQLLARIGDRCGVALQLADLFRYPTVAGLARLIARSSGGIVVAHADVGKPGEKHVAD